MVLHSRASRHQKTRESYAPPHVAGDFLDQDYAFVYGPAWFTRLGDGLISSAEFGTGNFVVSGCWVGWQGRGAGGKPVVVHASSDDSHTILVELNITFLAHLENTFRLLGNAIFNGLD